MGTTGSMSVGGRTNKEFGVKEGKHERQDGVGVEIAGRKLRI